MLKSMFRVILSVFIIAIPAYGLSIQDVDDWGYQLQTYPDDALDELQSSAFDLLVIDYSATGDDPEKWSAQDIETLRSEGPCGDRIVLAYFSIGEAESYRYYWNPAWVDAQGDPVPGVAPAWLGPTNPDWEGNYKVRYWLSGWQDILFGTSSGPDQSYLDRILDQGFDGVYLDIVDGFEFWGPEDIGGNGERITAGADMIDLVESIAVYARGITGHEDFLVVPQNGSYIIDPDVYGYAADPEAEAAVQKARYFGVISGIGVEDVFYRGSSDENNPFNPDSFRLDLLDEFKTGGKVVLSIEYLTNTVKIADYYTTVAPAESFIPYASVRDLDQMTINAGFEPDCETAHTGILHGQITLERPGVIPPDPSLSIPLRITICNQGEAMETYSTVSDSSGEFTVSDVRAGTFDILVKNVHTLATRTIDVTIPAGSATPLTDLGILAEGDANDDNSVTSADFFILKASYNLQEGEPGYDERADFNEDGVVMSSDFFLLRSHYNQGGQDCGS